MGVEARLIVGGSSLAAPDPILVAAIAQARHRFDQLASGEMDSIDQIVDRDHVDASDVGRQIRLAFLAPDIVEAILAGTQPLELTARRLKRVGQLPLYGEGQRGMLGFV